MERQAFSQMWRSLFKTQTSSPPYYGKVEIFSRHCFFSDASSHKKRFASFSRKACYENLLDTIDPAKANLTFLYDSAKGIDHFLQNEKNHPVIQFSAGAEAASFLYLLDYLETLSLHPETILYLVEDDYLHKEKWVDLLLEAFAIEGVDYATLYDHRDKYFFPQYRTLRSQIFLSPSSHWRTIPSTTQTFAVRWKTLSEDLSIHRRFSQKRTISADHEKFTLLTKRGRKLISPMPGWATHAEPQFASPLYDWNQLLLKGV